jgi:hypothetical protein
VGHRDPLGLACPALLPTSFSVVLFREAGDSCCSLRHPYIRPPDGFVHPTAKRKGVMDWTIIGVNFLYAALGIVLMWVAYRLFDRLTPQVDFADELKKGNVAVAIFIAALFIAIALIVGRALN